MVFRCTDARPTFQPRPNGPFPEPESYERFISGERPPARVGDSWIGNDRDMVPFAGFTAKLSLMGRKAPPPLPETSKEVRKEGMPVPRGSILWFPPTASLGIKEDAFLPDEKAWLCV